MISEVLHDHFVRVAELYGMIEPGKNLTPVGARSPAETALLTEIAHAREALRNSVDALERQRRPSVATGEPKGSWAHVYYVSFHDPSNSHGPTEGFYPVFLASVDQQKCWIALIVAAASVGISGRGGWSKRRGAQLRKRADLLGRNLEEGDGWLKGPIDLGSNGTSLREDSGSARAAGRAYECCTVISKVFNMHAPPANLGDWLKQAFSFYDAVLTDESVYIETSMPRVSEAELHEQASAAVTGKAAEDYFMEWAPNSHPEWGAPVRRTDRVGLGYDIDFPQVGLKVEVKGCRGKIEDLRVTEREWKEAKKHGEDYLLAVVSNLGSGGEKLVSLIRDPYRLLCGVASRQVRLQVSYSIPHSFVGIHVIRSSLSFYEHKGTAIPV